MRAFRVGLVAASVLVLSGCTSAAQPQVVTSGHYSAVVDVPQSASGDAAIAGSLTRDSAGCWGLTPSGGSGFRPTIWPHGTKQVGKKLLIPGVFAALSVGTAITGGGGGGPASRGYAPCIAKGEVVTYISGISLSH